MKLLKYFARQILSKELAALLRDRDLLQMLVQHYQAQRFEKEWDDLADDCSELASEPKKRGLIQ